MISLKSTYKNKSIMHLCNLGTKAYKRWINIYSHEEINKCNKKDKDIIWLVNVHLNWLDNFLENNYGFDIAIYLRLVRKSKAPIIFYSPINEKYFEAKSKEDQKYLILFGRGSRFIQTPFKDTTLESVVNNTRILTNASLHDVSTMLCNLKGIVIDRLNHALKFNYNLSLVDEVISIISPYLSVLQKRLIEIDSYVEKLKVKINEKDEEGFFVIKQQFLNQCSLYLSDNNLVTQQSFTEYYRVLLLEDNEKELKEFCDNLGKKFDVVAVNTSDDAIKELDKDKNNSFLAVITDWRLYSDKENNYWQNMQGYEILEYASTNGFRALFTLTSQASFVVHQIRNLMNVKFMMFNKENLRKPEQWQLFGDVLFEQCNEVVELISSLPTSKNWSRNVNKNNKPIKSLRQQYIDVWNSPERNIYFNNISEKSNEIWSYYRVSRKNEYKDLKALNTEFGIQLSTTNPELEAVLILRRIWMALWFNLPDSDKRLSKELISIHSEKIYEMMFAPGYRGEKSTNANQTAYKLCLEINEVQRRIMLPEEKSWLIEKELI